MMNEGTKAVMNVYYQNATMGAQAIEAVLKHTKHPNFRALLEKQLAAYREQQVELLHTFSASGDQPTDNPAWLKAYSDMGIKLHTLVDESDENLAKMMVEGTNMGIITILQTIHAHSDIPKDTQQTGQEILKRENAYLESLKEYL